MNTQNIFENKALIREYEDLARSELHQMLNANEEKIGPVIVDVQKLAKSAVEKVMKGIQDGSFERLSLVKLFREELKRALAEQGILRYKNDHCKYPTVEEQIQRNANLNKALEEAKENQDMRRRILKLANCALDSKVPTEVFNMEDCENLTAESINDLTDNFLMWSAKHISGKNMDYFIVVYLYLFHGLDTAGVIEKIKSLKGLKDGDETVPTIDYIENTFEEVLEIFAKDGQQMLEEFLTQASFNDTGDKKLIKSYEKVREARKRYMNIDSKLICPDGSWTLDHGSRRLKRVSANDLHNAERTNIDFPKTDFEKFIQNSDIILAKRGDFSARNRLTVSAMRLAASMIGSRKMQNYIDKNRITSEDRYDIESGLYERILKKVLGYDPRMASLTTYIASLTLNALIRFLIKMDIVAMSGHARQEMNNVTFCMPKTIEQLTHLFSLPRQTIEAILKENPNDDELQLLKNINTETINAIKIKHKGLSDAEIAMKYDLSIKQVARIKEDIEKGKRFMKRFTIIPKNIFLEEDGDGENEIWHEDYHDQYPDVPDELIDEPIAESLFDEKLRTELVEAALELLSANERQLLHERFVDDCVFEEMGERRGLTRERMRQQIGNDLFEKIRAYNDSSTEKSDEMEDESENSQSDAKDTKRRFKLSDVIVVTDKEKFDQWCNEKYGKGRVKKMPKIHKRWLELYLGIEDGVRYPPKAIAVKLKDEDGENVPSVKLIIDVLRKIMARLKITLKKLEDDELFVISKPKGQGYREVARLLKTAYETIES